MAISAGEEGLVGAEGGVFGYGRLGEALVRFAPIVIVVQSLRVPVSGVADVAFEISVIAFVDEVLAAALDGLVDLPGIGLDRILPLRLSLLRLLKSVVGQLEFLGLLNELVAVLQVLLAQLLQAFVFGDERLLELVLVFAGPTLALLLFADGLSGDLASLIVRQAWGMPPTFQRSPCVCACATPAFRFGLECSGSRRRGRW